MLDSIKRWLGTAAAETHGFDEQAAWAKSREWTLRGVREIDGFVIDGRTGPIAWRLEWGPSQRPYIEGQELRLRADVSSVPRELQALVLNRELMESMEKAVFEQYVEGVQTRIDTTTPPEMRWLVMFPKLSGTEMKSLREGYGALCNYKPWLQQWLDSPLSQALAALPPAADQPLVLMIARRRLSLRTALPAANVVSLEARLQLFECALKEAQRVSIDDIDAATPSTQPSMFPASLLPTEAQRS
jgi:hypothetical protein